MSHSPASADQSIIWVLTGDRVGDNLQVLHAAEALRRPYKVKSLKILPRFASGRLPVEASIRFLDPSSDPLGPPWPDLCLAIGRHLSMAALWIKAQSGGTTRVALFNLPKGRHDDFDLIVVPGVYRSLDSPKVCRIKFPLATFPGHAITAARQSYEDQLGTMARPLNVFLVGGPLPTHRLDAGIAEAMFARIKTGCGAAGSIFVSTSRRTPLAVTTALERSLRPQDRIYRWSPDAVANPYAGLLAHGDVFIVTDDSLSMMTEVARLGKPLVIAETPQPFRLLEISLRKFGLGRPKNMRLANQMLLDSGHAVRLGEMLRNPPCPLPDETHVVVERLEELLN